MDKNVCEKGGKHEVAEFENIIDRLGGRIFCPKCGMVGHVSQGRRKHGRPARVFWHLTADRVSVPGAA